MKGKEINDEEREEMERRNERVSDRTVGRIQG